MSQPVNVPAVGPVQRRWVVLGGLVVVVVVGYAYWRRSRRPSSVYDPAAGTVDLGTGGYQNPAPTSPRSGTVDDGGGGITSNGEWSARAVEALVGAGYNPQYAAVTIGKYLGGLELTPEEADLVRAAFALVGEPPQPLAIVIRSSPGPTSSSGTENFPVAEGQKVSDVVNHVRAYRTTYTQSDLLGANAGVSVAPANANGYIGADNPDRGDSYLVFSANQTVLIPAR